MTYLLADSVFSWTNLFSFIIGAGFGVLIMLAALSVFISKGQKKSRKIHGSKIDDLTKEKIEDLIESKQEAFVQEFEEENSNGTKIVGTLCLELLHEVSSYYYPESKYPEYELTITEAIELVHYIADRVGLAFNKWLGAFKNLRISTIFWCVDASKKLSKPLKAAKDSGADEAYQVFRTISKSLDPIFWIKKVIGKGLINYTLKTVFKEAIQIVGEETNKIYSKQAFKNDEDAKVKKGINEIYNDEEDK